MKSPQAPDPTLDDAFDAAWNGAMRRSAAEINTLFVIEKPDNLEVGKVRRDLAGSMRSTAAPHSPIEVAPRVVVGTIVPSAGMNIPETEQ